MASGRWKCPDARGGLLGAICLGLLWSATAEASPRDWKLVTTDEKATNVPAGSRSYGYRAKSENPIGKGAHRLTVRMPLHNAPSGVAGVSIERSIETAEEGDHVEVTFAGDPSDAVEGDEPPAKIAVFVHCVFEDEEGHEKEPAWVLVGTRNVKPNTDQNQFLKAPIRGAGCAAKVKLKENREIDGARIQLRGADDTDDHRRRTAYLISFKLFDPGQGENSPRISDNFTNEV
jgi:hypothetical protein